MVFLFSCDKKYKPRIIQSVNIEEYEIDSVSIRAIDVSANGNIVFAGSNGLIGKAFANNKKIETQKVTYDTIVPHFRAIALNNDTIFTLSIGNPALLFSFDFINLNLVYSENHNKVFYDALQFFDDQNAIAMGDPTDNCLSIIISSDSGKTWNKVSCDVLPKIKIGEAAFAASNGNIATIDSSAWIVTGGTASRVFYTANMGATWEVFETPIISGGQMTGIYSVDFYDKKNGIIMGGDWDHKENNFNNKAITNDGGKTWQIVANGSDPGYMSSVQYVPNTEGKELFAVGSTGVSFSNDSGHSWLKVSNRGYYTIRFVDENLAWLGGLNKIGKLKLN
jgi:hypothetical protein